MVHFNVGNNSIAFTDTTTSLCAASEEDDGFCYLFDGRRQACTASLYGSYNGTKLRVHTETLDTLCCAAGNHITDGTFSFHSIIHFDSLDVVEQQNP